MFWLNQIWMPLLSKCSTTSKIVNELIEHPSIPKPCNLKVPLEFIAKWNDADKILKSILPTVDEREAYRCQIAEVQHTLPQVLNFVAYYAVSLACENPNLVDDVFKHSFLISLSLFRPLAARDIARHGLKIEQVAEVLRDTIYHKYKKLSLCKNCVLEFMQTCYKSFPAEDWTDHKNLREKVLQKYLFQFHEKLAALWIKATGFTSRDLIKFKNKRANLWNKQQKTFLKVLIKHLDS
jgi:hypothetical protein